MNAAHESRALSLRALNPLLTPSQRSRITIVRLNAWVCIQHREKERERERERETEKGKATQDKVQHFKLQSML